MKVRSTTRFLLSLVLAVFGLVGGVVAGVPEIALLAAPWAVMTGLRLGRPFSPDPRVTVQVGDERVIEGDEVDLSVSVRCADDAFVRVRPQPNQRYRQDQLDLVDLPEQAEFVAAGTSRRFEFSLKLPEWGTWDVGAVGVTVESPLGEFVGHGAAKTERLVRVHPSTHALKAMVEPRSMRPTAGLHRSRESGRGVEFADIRAFTPGDSRRDINWRASARAGELIVSQRHPDRAANVVLLIDSFTETDHDARRVLSMIVRAAAALADGHLGATDRVGIVEFGGLIRWIVPGTGATQLHRIVDALLESTLYANAAPKELPELSRRIWPQGTTVVALTPLLDDRFVEAVRTSRHRGHDVVVLECSAFAEVDEALYADDAVRRASQALYRAERQSLRDRLADEAIVVVPWAPDEPVELALARLRRRRIPVGR